jgi:hypothetical protein
LIYFSRVCMSLRKSHLEKCSTSTAQYSAKPPKHALQSILHDSSC